MKNIVPIVISILIFPILSLSGQLPDFTVTKFITSQTGFLHIQLENLSQHAVTIKEEWREKTFLTLYINRIKRAEFTFKHLDPALFKKNGSIVHRTNFRTGKPMTITVKINHDRLIPESSYFNNELTEKMHGKE